MGQLIKRYPDGSFLEYDRGGFDDCVFTLLTHPETASRHEIQTTLPN